MTQALITMPDQALADGFARHVVHWARERDAPDDAIDALRAAARATSLATAAGHVCTYLADIAAAGGVTRCGKPAQRAASGPAWSARRTRPTRAR